MKVDYQKIIKFIFYIIKISVRDMYLIPLNNLKEMLVLSVSLTGASLCMYLLGLHSLLDWRGALLATIILIIIKLFCKPSDYEN